MNNNNITITNQPIALKAIKSALYIKEYCALQEDCDKCIMYNAKETCCIIKKLPEFWDLESINNTNCT